MEARKLVKGSVHLGLGFISLSAFHNDLHYCLQSVPLLDLVGSSGMVVFDFPYYTENIKFRKAK